MAGSKAACPKVPVRGQGSFEGQVAEQEALEVAYHQDCNRGPYLDLKAFLEEALPFHREVHQEEHLEEVALESRHLVQEANQ